LDIRFTPNEARVIGCLMEKSVVTPDQYPLSLNALVNACNQKSSREPVLNLDQGVVQRTANELAEKKHVMVENLNSRVDKYRQRFCNTQFALIQFSPAEYAVICLLLLRGPQTPGELKSRSGRLHEFATPKEVETALESLMSRTDGPYVARLPREPRRQDNAYAHLFGGPVESALAETRIEAPARDAAPTQSSAPRTQPSDDAMAALEQRIDALEQELAKLKRELGVG